MDIRFGVKTGCDAFFMPRDATRRVLDECATDAEFHRRTGARRSDVLSGRLKIIEDGAGVLHPIESAYVAPEVHSLMNVDRPTVRWDDVDRLVLLVGDSLSEIKGTWAHRYIQYGKTASFASKKSGAKPVPERSTVAACERWYDLTPLVKPGFALWPKAQQYRHIVPANPDRVVANCNLYDVSSSDVTEDAQLALTAVLNSTLVALFKTFYGRFAGMEGNLKTEVVDVNLLEVPDVRGISAQLSSKLTAALESMQGREVGRLVEEQLMECHSPERARRIAAGPVVLSEELRRPDRRALDEAVFELLGMSDAEQRTQLVDTLHEETALHFRAIRVVEIQKMRQRAATAERKLNVHDLAADCWDAAALEDATPLKEWVERQPSALQAVSIPEERPAALSPSPMFDPSTVYFGKARRKTRDYASRGQAELVMRLAELGISGPIRLPAELEPAMRLLDAVNHRLDKAQERFQQIAANRVGGNGSLQQQVLDLLVRWYTLGRHPAGAKAATE